MRGQIRLLSSVGIVYLEREFSRQLKLPEVFRIRNWKRSKVTNDLEAGENPVGIPPALVEEIC
ncbi:hypothetical protein ACIQU6_21035 [Streptomyces sp. NPDC090442]|uniref:hypothetical protein n=1 Tax=Streptomyces sp. NPDC090442 TaxID=3365962 RepID=UPI00382C82BB